MERPYIIWKENQLVKKHTAVANPPEDWKKKQVILPKWEIWKNNPKIGFEGAIYLRGGAMSKKIDVLERRNVENHHVKKTRFWNPSRRPTYFQGVLFCPEV